MTDIRFSTLDSSDLRSLLQLRLGTRQLDVPVPVAATEQASFVGVVTHVTDSPHEPWDEGLLGALVDEREIALPRPSGDQLELAFSTDESSVVEGKVQAAALRTYRLEPTQDRPPFVTLELQLARSAGSWSAPQPHDHRALFFVALGGEGFSLAVPEAFDRYARGVPGGNILERFTTTEDGDELMAAGHFVPVWGIHQWDYRLVATRRPLTPQERALLGVQVLPPRHYPLHLGADGRLLVLPCVPDLCHVDDALQRIAFDLWPGRYSVHLSGHTTGGYGVGLLPTYLLEFAPPEALPPSPPLNGETLPFLFESASSSAGTDRS